MQYWMIETGPQGETVSGRMFVKEKEGPLNSPRNFCLTNTIDKAMKKATDLGAKVLMGKTEIPGHGWSAFPTDPEGNVFGFFQSPQSYWLD